MAGNIKLLVVDDEEDLAEIVAESFEDHFDSSYVTSGDAALKLLSSDSVNIIISDSNMPGMTGLELLKKIKESSNKVLFYLSSGDASISEDQVKSLGGHGTFEKPYSINDVIVKINEDLKKVI